MQINLEFDANALAAPQSFRDGLQQAASVLDAAINDPIYANIAVGYGEIGLGTSGYMPLPGNESFGGATSVIQVSYAALRTALASHETSSAQVQEVNALPNTTALNGKSTFYLSSAEAKALGVIPAAYGGVDGDVGFPTSFTGSVLVDTGITELTHALGLENFGYPLGLVAYTSPGVHFLPATYTATTPAYFSLDGGNTNLGNYDVGFDDTLFTGINGDPLDVGGTIATSLTPLDLEEIAAVGFDTGGPTTPPANQIATTTSPTGLTSVSVNNVSVPQNGSVSALAMLNSVAVPAGQTIATISFDDLGGNGGYFSLNGVGLPEGQYFSVLDTELGALQYIGGANPGSDRISVYATAYGGQAAYNFATLTASTVPAPPVYSIAPANAVAADGTSGTTPLTFTVSRTGDPSKAATLGYSVAGSGSNPAPLSLFANPSGSVTLAAGAVSTTLTINAVGQQLTTTDGFTVNLSGNGAAIGTGSASGSVGANSGTPTYSIAASNANQPDATSGTTPYTFTVTRTGSTSQAATLNYSVAGSGSNPAPGNLFQGTSGSVTLASGATSATITVNANGQMLANDEGFTVTISGGNGTIASATASGTVGANYTPLDPHAIASNTVGVYGFANPGVPGFTAVVNADGSADLAKGASAVTPSFIGGYVAGIEIRVMANLESIGGSTAQIDAQLGRDVDSISALLTAGNAAEGFGFLSGLTTGGPTGLSGGGIPPALNTDLLTALGSDQQAMGALGGCITGAVAFAQGYINNVGAGQGPVAALHAIESSALT